MATATLLQNVRWETYRDLVGANAEGALRLAYDRGCLEIEMSPLPRHEGPKRLLEIVVDTILYERGIDYAALGSITLVHEASRQGVEPDSCFYIQSFAALPPDRETIDPAAQVPDLAVEVDVTSGSLEKLPIYARLGVPEVWRWRDGLLTIFVAVSDGGYQQSAHSRAIPDLEADRIGRWLEESRRMPPILWRRQVAGWARGEGA